MEAINYFLANLIKKDLSLDGMKNLLLLKTLMPKEKKDMVFKRNLRYGYSGNLIDKKIYGKIGLIVICIKLIYLISVALFLLLIPSRRNYIKSSFFFLRATGRFIGLFNYKPKKYI